ncbi:MAG: baseplate J/gp47 family protein [Peptostreptococcaceae bacterium]|nr:baseplate J/gp47 family protein [Peptostreptococcaceae bacterium]
MFGLSKEGFKRKRYSDIELELFTRARDFFGEDINLSERSPLGIFLRIIAWSLSLIWQLAERVYHQSHLPAAEGISLDYVCEKGDIYRFPALRSSGEVKITGTPKKKIYAGFKVGTVSGQVFETTKEYEIGPEGSVLAEVRCTKAGNAGNVVAEEITILLHPEIGITAVTNPKSFQNGRDVETDDELRERYKLSFVATGKATIDAIRAHLLKIPTLRGVKILENDTMQEKNGMQPKSIKVIALGGTDEEVAQAILDSKAAGIATNGNVSYMAVDNIGEKHEMRFSRATDVPIHVKATVKFLRSSYNTEEVKEEIRQRILRYINAIGMGNDVILTRVLSRILCGDSMIEDVSLLIGKSSSELKAENIDILDEEVPTTTLDKVVIVVES